MQEYEDVSRCLYTKADVCAVWGGVSHLSLLACELSTSSELAACACVWVSWLQVVATEVSKASVVAARHNIAANSAGNIFMARMSSEEFTETWKVKGTRNRWRGGKNRQTSSSSQSNAGQTSSSRSGN
jgi:hypothetical protein